MTSDQVVSTLSSLLSPVGGVDVVVDATNIRFLESWTDKLQRATDMETDTPEVLRECLVVVRKYRRVSVLADYPGTTNRFPIVHIMTKHLTMRSGRCSVRKY
jgi:threonine dehydrogenase-like Zn-dependent dehydrogenase